MSHEYVRLPNPGAGLRLHLNENTAGCSAPVLEAMRRVTREEAAFYPDYGAVHRACAAWIGVADDQVLLTNGLDEGIHAASFAWLPRDETGNTHDAIVVEPAFDMYAACADAAGGRLVTIAPRPDFDAFPLEEILAAITPRTRLVFLTSPNNPTGLEIPRPALRVIARALPDTALVFLDEAYVDFGTGSFLDELPAWPNVLIGRTFAKAHGLAAVRVGCVVGTAPVIARLRRVVPPYSVNVFAMAGLAAAIEDDDYLAWYRVQVAESRARIYAACDRQGVRYWPSHANFVLVRVGPRARALAAAMARRGIFVRDRSGEPGCEGCLRITAGVLEHTERCVTAFEEELCAAR